MHTHLVHCGQGRKHEGAAEGQGQCSEDKSRARSGLRANTSTRGNFCPNGRFVQWREYRVLVWRGDTPATLAARCASASGMNRVKEFLQIS